MSQTMYTTSDWQGLMFYLCLHHSIFSRVKYDLLAWISATSRKCINQEKHEQRKTDGPFIDKTRYIEYKHFAGWKVYQQKSWTYNPPFFNFLSF